MNAEVTKIRDDLVALDQQTNYLKEEREQLRDDRSRLKQENEKVTKNLGDLCDELQINKFGENDSLRDAPLERSWIGILVGILGIVFVILDVGSDAFLAYQYSADASLYARVRASNITDSCKSQYFCMNGGNFTPVSPSCRSEFSDSSFIDIPKHQLGEKQSRDFMLMTTAFIAIGCLIQTIIATVLACRRNKVFTSLPKLVSILTFVTCPLMLGPVVVTLYLVVKCAKGVSEEETNELKMLISTLKMGELLFESIPQLFINALSIYTSCANNITSNQLSFSHISIVKWFSVATSILGLSYAVADFILKKSRDFFISKKHHPWSSFLGIFLWFLIGILAVFSSIITINTSVHQSKFAYLETMPGVRSIPGIIGGTIPYGVFAPLHIISFLLLFLSSCTTKRCCKRLKFCATILYLVCVVVMVGLNSHLYSVTQHKPLTVTIALMTVHLFIALLILPSATLGATVFNPFVKISFFLLRQLCCEKLRKKVGEWEQWTEQDDDSMASGSEELNDETEVVVDGLGKDDGGTRKEGGIINDEFELRTLEVSWPLN